MLLVRSAFKRAAGVIGVAACFAWTASPAAATGTLTIQRHNAAASTYRQVEIKVLYGGLFVTSEDGKGTLVIPKAACSFQRQIFVCYVTGATLVQAGEATPLSFKRGTIYFNSTDEPQQLSRSTTKIAPHSLMLSMTTDRGTYIGLTGRMDEVVKS
ncbi:MAG TPA: hypothetical protein VHR97_13865 [Candidatus Baltobacteraceae bacterium]|jgi:hypothetical protein|nr:hypothetical protein [Candidatus Baltobacteraceae bacterium]